MEEPSSSWWSRKCGGRDLLTLALPLVISTATWTVMNFIDRMFLLWHNPDEMAAALPAAMLHFTILCFPLGICLYVNTFVAQYHGAERSERIGSAIGQGLRVGLFSAPLLLGLAPFASQVFALAGHVPQIALYEVIYYQVMAVGAVAVVFSATLRSFFTGLGKTRTVMIVDCSGALLNILLDYVFVFGKFGFPELGIEGAAWATVIALWSKTVVFWWLVHRPEFRIPFGIARIWHFDAQLMRRLLYYGGANGLQMFIEIAGFAGFTLLVGTLGQRAMTATTLAFNVNSVAFVPLIGLGIAVSTLVGQQQGAGRSDLAARAAWTGFWVALAYSGLFGVLYIAVPDLFLFGHAAGIAAAEFTWLRETTVVLLRFVAAYCLFDAMNVIFSSAIKGAGDTKFILIVNCIVSPIPVLVGAWGVSQYAWGLIACWWIITLWISSLGIIFMARFLQGRWRTMRVIDEDDTNEQPQTPAKPALLACKTTD